MTSISVKAIGVKKILECSKPGASRPFLCGYIV